MSERSDYRNLWNRVIRASALGGAGMFLLWGFVELSWSNVLDDRLAFTYLDSDHNYVVGEAVGSVPVPFGCLPSVAESPLGGINLIRGRSREGKGQFYVSFPEGNRRRVEGVGADQELTASFDPSWSPSGREIVFSGVSRGNYGLYVVSIDNLSEARRIKNFNDEKVRGAVWSPRGDRIAFFTSLYFPKQNVSIFRVWTINPDGSHLTNVSQTGKHPRWSNDGRNLAFISLNPPGISILGEDGNVRLASYIDSELINFQWLEDCKHLLE